MKIDKLKISLGFILISLIWGSTWLAIKLGLDSIPPFYGVAFRFTIALFFFVIILKVRGEHPPFDRNALKVYISMGLLSFSIPFGMIYWAEQFVPTGLASVLFAIYPFVVAILSHLFLEDEKMNPRKILGIVFSFLGVVVIFWGDIGGEHISIIGMAAVLFSTALQAISLIVTKKYGRGISSVSLSFGGIAFGLPVMYLMAFVLDNFSAIRLDLNGVGSLVYLATFGTVVTFTIYYSLLKKIEVVYLSFVSFITPMIAVILGAVFLNESLSSEIFVGAFLVLSGLLAANSKEIFETIRRRKNGTTVRTTDEL